MPRSANTRAIAELESTACNVDASSRPAGSASPRAYYRSGRDQAVRRVPASRCSRHRDQRRRADRGDRRVRPRRLRRCHRRARRPIPRRRSGRPRAHLVGRSCRCLRRDQPTRASVDHAGLGQHRPPTGSSIRARRPDRIPRAPAGNSAKTSDIYVEAVHRLNDLGAVVTYAAHGTSREGFDAEWREIDVLTVDGDLINRCEIFDEADLDAALARFDQTQPAGTAAGERGKPSDRTLCGAPEGARLGRHGGAAGRRLLQ